MAAAVAPHYNCISPDDGVSSAHELPGEKFIEVFTAAKVTNLDDLFGQSGNRIPACPPHWETTLRKAIVNRRSEDLMNGSIQKLFNKNFPDQKHFEVGRNKKVQEQALSTMLGFEYGNGLPIKMSWKPDFCLRCNHGYILGQGKNHQKYSVDDAIRQNTTYMLPNLYDQVVRRSRLPPAVYGIAVAGSRCKETERGGFTVVLQRLSFPQKVGGRLELRQLHLTQNEGKLAKVWEFLSRVLQAQVGTIQFGQNSPALLQVPYHVLLMGRWPDDVEMVQNGTACLVLRVRSYPGLVGLIDLLDDRASSIGSQYWKEEDLDFPLFFKSKNYLLCDSPARPDYYCLAGRGHSLDLDEAYKVFPVVTDNGVYILVANLGIPVLEEDCEAHHLTVPRLVVNYHAFMERIIGFERMNRLYHGDIHVGNVTYFAARDSFMLIDYDEARLGELVIRKARTPEQERLYPAALLKFAELYTKHQLMMALEDILKVYDTNDECLSVATFFEDYPLPPELKPEDVATRYETLVALLNEFGQSGKRRCRPRRDLYITAPPLTILYSTAEEVSDG